jgi:uncharacterized damage-inducible protein DinB
VRDFVASIEREYQRYKKLGEGAFAQLRDDELTAADGASGNSIAVIVWHMAGNFESRFTDFLTSDGEKPWRKRDEEFATRAVTRAEVIAKWERGWTALFHALAPLADADLGRTITIRSEPHRVYEALYRSLAHAAYHVGQIVHIAKLKRGDEWRWLSIPPGQSDEFQRQMERTHGAGG